MHLRLTVEEGGRCHFAYAFGDDTFTAVALDFTASEGRWVGARFGLFATAAPEADPSTSGIADFASVSVTSPTR